MLEENKTEYRIERHNISQEDFTPEEIVEKLYQGSEEVFSDFDKIVLDPCAGVCYILMTLCRAEDPASSCINL